MNLPNPTIYKFKVANYRISLALKSPRLFDIDELVYPKNSVIHYCTFNPSSYGPTLHDPFFSKVGRKLPIINVSELDTPIGTSFHYPNKLVNLANEHRRVNKIFRIMDPADIKPLDPMTPLIVNYDLLSHLYKYRDRFDVGYSIWRNTERTLWTNVLQYVRKYSESTHFVTIDLDNEMLNTSQIRIASKLIGRAMLKVLKDREDFLAREIFIYFMNLHAIKSGKKAETLQPTIFDGYTVDDFKKINIVLIKNGKYGVYPVSDLFDKLLKKAESNKYMPYELIRIMILRFIQLSEATTILDIIKGDSGVEKPTTSGSPENSVDTLPENKNEFNPSTDISEAFDEASEIDELEGIDFDLPEIKDDLFNKADALLSNNEIDEDQSDIRDETITDLKEETDNAVELTSEHINKEVSLEPFKVIENPTDYLLNTVETLKAKGNFSDKEIKNIIKNIEASKNLKSPITGKPLVEDAIVTKEDIDITPKSTEINIDVVIPDESMRKSTLVDFDRNYIRNVMHKDMSSVILNVQKAGMIITNVTAKPHINAATKSVEFTINVSPIDGNDSTLKYTLPIIDDDGSYMVGGVVYKLRKQRKDLPIRKTDYNEVALTSHYGKLFITRASQKRFDESYWLYNKIIALYQDPKSGVTGIIPTPSFNNYDKTPLVFSFLARYFKELSIKGNVLYLSYNKRASIVKDRFDLKTLEKDGTYVLCGITREGDPIVIDNNNNFFAFKNNEYLNLGNIYNLLEIDNPDIKEFADISVLGKKIPVGIALSFLSGLKPLLKYTGVKYQLIPPNKKDPVGNNIVIRFLNYKLVIFDPSKEHELLFAGFKFAKDRLVKYNFEAFDDRSVYLSVLEDKGITARNLKELVLLDQMFVDPMTKQVLELMNEPTDFKGLLFRSIELLLTDWYPDSQDTNYQAITGYERVNGIIYKHLVDTIRGYKLKNLYNKTKLDLNPLAISMELSKDQILVADINPIDDIKQQEDVTYTGFGGRSKQSLNKKSRAYHINDLGIISEATKESGDVGISAYLSADPSIVNLRGMVKPLKGDELKASNFFSAAAMLAPGSTNDAAVRVNFVSVQQSHTISTIGYHQPYIRTGYEYVVAKRTSEAFAYSAEYDGIVTSVDENAIVVTYNNGTVKGVKLGNTIGHAEGQYYLHPIATTLKPGMKFKKGKVIAYNTYFFEQDMLYPDEVILKMYKLVKTAIVENSDVFEDSSSIRDTIASDFSSTVLEQRKFMIDISQEIHMNVKEGTELNANTVLLYILEKYEALPGTIDDNTLEALKRFANMAPKANLEGSVMDIVVYYNSELDELSSSLKKLAKESDKRIAEKNKHDGIPITNGKVDSSYRVDGNQLTPGKAVIIIYIKHNDGLSVGDKLVFSNQMKTVVGGVIDYPIVTSDGEQVDAFFGFRSLLARVVNSPMIIGTTNVLLDKFTKKFIELYKK